MLFASPCRLRRRIMPSMFYRQSVPDSQTTHKSNSEGDLKMPTVLETSTKDYPVHYSTIKIDNLDVFYRDAGPKDASVLLLLHGFPTSSNMFRNLIPRLAGTFRLVAPDYPGFVLTTMPDHREFSYTFENLMNVVDGLVA